MLCGPWQIEHWRAGVLRVVIAEGFILSLMSLGAMSFCLHVELSYLEQPCGSQLTAEASLGKVLKPWLLP